MSRTIPPSEVYHHQNRKAVRSITHCSSSPDCSPSSASWARSCCPSQQSLCSKEVLKAPCLQPAVVGVRVLESHHTSSRNRINPFRSLHPVMIKEKTMKTTKKQPSLHLGQTCLAAITITNDYCYCSLLCFTQAYCLFDGESTETALTAASPACTRRTSSD